MELVLKTFEKLTQAKCITDVTDILADLEVERKFHMDIKKYPPVNFSITKDEINGLVEKGVFTEDYQVGDVSNESPMTRLLYSVIWKQGDLAKVKHIVEGVVSDRDDEKDSALVFFQFGKYMTKEAAEPIIDQHVLRAFGLFKILKCEERDQKEINRLINSGQVTKKDKPLIAQYKYWIKNDLREELRAHANYASYVDKVLFAVGKKIKATGIY